MTPAPFSAVLIRFSDDPSAYHARYNALRRQKAKDAGLCVRCAKEPARANRTSCEKCA